MKRAAALAALLLCLALLAGCGCGSGGGSSGGHDGDERSRRRVAVETAAPGFNAARGLQRGAARRGHDPLAVPRPAAPRAPASSTTRRRNRHQRPRRHRRIDRHPQARRRSLRRVPQPQRRPEAEIVGFDPFADVALLKVDPDGLELHPLRARRRQGARGRRAGGGDRQPLRRTVLALGRRRLGDQPLGQIADRVPDRGRDPDRRLDQPRQLRRPAARQPTRGCSGSTSRSRPTPAPTTASASPSRSRRSNARSTELEKTARPNTPTSASRARRSTRSWRASSASTPTFGGLIADVVPGGPAEKAGLEGGTGETPVPGGRIHHRRRRDPRRSKATT